MAIFDFREYTTRTYEWAVPTGCPAEEFNKAWQVALVTYRRVHNLPEDAAPNDGGWLRVYAVDDQVVLRFDVRESAPMAAAGSISAFSPHNDHQEVDA